jgi:rubrerythrin
MYSISREGEATSLFRSVAKDEMKHLFIVSNILNALGVSPPYPKPHEGHVDSVPTFPIETQTKLICFHFQL